MGTLDDVRRLLQEGKSEQEVVGAMLGQGSSMSEITEALSQSRIKEAVSGNQEQEQNNMIEAESVPSPSGLPEYSPQETSQEEYNNDASSSPYSQAEQGYPQYQQEAQYSYPDEQAQQYSQYPPVQSTDLTTEIAEQVLTEKLSPIRSKIESILDLKASVESRIESLDERMKRIERIIDRLQLSVLQRVGEYISNVEDIKKEILETQKTFKSMHHSHQK